MTPKPRKPKGPRKIESYVHHTSDSHTCTPETCPSEGGYYVSCFGDAPSEFWLMAGPYQSHAEALALVNKARTIGADNNPRSIWYRWGTVRMKDSYREPGRMTERNLL